MRFMLLQNYGSIESEMPPMHEWSEADVQAHIEFQIALNQQLEALGQLVDAQALDAPTGSSRSIRCSGRWRTPPRSRPLQVSAACRSASGSRSARS